MTKRNVRSISKKSKKGTIDIHPAYDPLARGDYYTFDMGYGMYSILSKKHSPTAK